MQIDWIYQNKLLTIFKNGLLLFSSLICSVSWADQYYSQCRNSTEAFCKPPEACKLEIKPCPDNDCCIDPCPSCPPIRPSISWLGCQNISSVITGYAFAGYNHAQHHNGSYTLGGFNPVFNFLYKDIVLAEAEVDFGINSKGHTTTVLDYASLDFFLHKYVTFIAGKFLSPLGQFMQNLKPAWINKLPSRPPGFDPCEAAPESEIGLQLRGGFPICETLINYALYVGNGPEAYVYNGLIDSISYRGFNSDNDGHKIVGGRLGFLPWPCLELGISAAHGRVGLFYPILYPTTCIDYCRANLYFPQINSNFFEVRPYVSYGADFSFRCDNFTFRGEYIRQTIDGDPYSLIPGNRWRSYYLQIAYRIFAFEPVLRYGNYKTFQNQYRHRQVAMGIDYWMAPSVVAKFAYEFNSGQLHTINNDNRFLFQVAYGF